MNIGAPGGARIPNPWFRRPMLYPIELQVQIGHFLMGNVKPLTICSEDLCDIHFTMDANAAYIVYLKTLWTQV